MSASGPHPWREVTLTAQDLMTGCGIGLQAGAEAQPLGWELHSGPGGWAKSRGHWVLPQPAGLLGQLASLTARNKNWCFLEATVAWGLCYRGWEIKRLKARLGGFNPEC